MKAKINVAILTNFEGVHGIRTTIDGCTRGKSLLDAIEAGVREVESSPLATTVGFGGAPNALGEMELDAAIMNGNTLQTGAVGALKGFRHPVSVARQVMERLPHVMLVGAGARRFAAEVGAEPGDSLSDDARDKYCGWAVKRGLSQDAGTGRSPLLDRIWKERREDIALGTTVFLAFSKTKGNDHAAVGNHFQAARTEK